MAAKKKAKKVTRRRVTRRADGPARPVARKSRASGPEADAARIVSAVRKKVKKSTIATLSTSDAMSDVTEWIPSGFIGLDEILGGGWPVGRASEVFGDEGCGKSALAHMAIKGVQSIGGIAVLLDYEAALDEEKILQLGIDPERLIYEIPDHIEQGWDIIWAIMEDLEKNAPKAPMLIVWDSIGGAVPKAELDATSSEKPHVGEVARAMSRGCRRMFKVIAKVRAHMMWISQERHKIGGGFSPFGPVKETSGGKGPKYASSVRLRCARVKTLKRLGVKARATGYQIKSITKKNKVAPPEQNMEWVIDFKRGPSPELSTLQTLLDAGVVRSSGGGKYRMKGLSDGFKKSEWINRMRTASFRKAAEAHCLAVVRAGGALAAREADETVENEE